MLEVVDRHAHVYVNVCVRAVTCMYMCGSFGRAYSPKPLALAPKVPNPVGDGNIKRSTQQAQPRTCHDKYGK